MLTDFYIAFAPLCFTVLGLWFLIVTTRHGEWRASQHHRRQASAVSLQLALPGFMGLVALIDPTSKSLWRSTFAASAIVGGLTMLYLVVDHHRHRHNVFGAIGLWVTTLLFAVVAVVAIHPSTVTSVGLTVKPVEVEALLLSILVFAGLAIAYVLLFEDVEH